MTDREPVPVEEAARLRALARYAILETPRDYAFDDLARLARDHRRTIAGIGFFDLDRVWFQALLGADPEGCSPGAASGAGSTPLARSLRFGDLASVPSVTSDGYTLGAASSRA